MSSRDDTMSADEVNLLDFIGFIEVSMNRKQSDNDMLPLSLGAITYNNISSMKRDWRNIPAFSGFSVFTARVLTIQFNVAAEKPISAEACEQLFGSRISYIIESARKAEAEKITNQG